MGKSNDCWGIEVGANAIKAIRLVRKKDRITLAAYEVLPFKKVLSTPDLNVAEAIQVNLDQFLSRHSVSRSRVVVSVAGHKAFSRFAKLPPVDPKRITDIVRFEAVQQIPFPIEQVEWDYHVFSQPDSPDVEVGIFAITKERIQEELENYRAVGLEIDAITLSPLAVHNALCYDLNLDDSSPGTIFLDIGTNSTDVIFADEGKLWLRTLPIGGNNFTEALVRAFKLSFPKAEKLKREAGTSKYARQIFQAMRPVFADLVQELQKTLGYYQSLNRDASVSRLYGLGSTFRLPGMAKFLRQQLQLEIIRPETFSGVEIDDKQASEIADQAPNLMTAYGCALQGLDLHQVEANVLPEDIINRRVWRAKQPWIAAAAALMLVGSGAAGAKLMIERSAYERTLTQSQPQIQRVTGEAQRLIGAWNQLEGSDDPRQKIENLRRILDYRDIWPKLLHDVNLAAEALGPQSELLEADYGLIASIPRNQRRRVYIDQVTAEYRLGGDAQPTRSAAQPAARRLEDIWSGFGQDEPMYDEYDMMGHSPGRGRGDQGAPVAEIGSDEPPQFAITVRGTTPHVEGAKFIVDHFIQWLRDNAERSDRPYHIVADSPTLVSIEQGQPERRAESGRRTTTAQPMFDEARRRTPIRTIERPTVRPGVGGVQQTGGQNAEAQPQLPVRPSDDEDASQDWHFTVTWVVQLVSPEDARRAEEDENPDSQARLSPDTSSASAAVRPTQAEGQL